MTQHQIKYLGPVQHTRSISVTEAKAAGFVLAEKLQWDAEHRHAVLVDNLDPTALEFFENDPDFKVTEAGAEDAAPEKPAKSR
jgi:hypothetical protein